MALNIQNSNYSGEVLEQLLTLAATGNELVEKGLIRVEPNIGYKFSIPRLKSGTMLQKRKEMPTDNDSKGNFTYSERALEPQDFMAFTTFNPRSFERVWRRWQPKGPLVFAQLPPEAQNALLAELAKQVKFELGWHLINGEYAETGDDKLFNGIVYRMANASDKVVVNSVATTMIGRLSDVKKAIPVWMRNNPDLRILMSITDFDTYDEELTAREHKGADYTDMNPERYKGIAIKPLANWPDGLVVATIASMDYDSNLWAGVDFQDDEDVIQIDKLTNAGEKYFFKMLLKVDTQIAFDEEVVWLDHRSGVPEVTITGDEEISVPATSGTSKRTYATSNGAAITAETETPWLTVAVSGNKVTITREAYAYDAEGEATREGTITIGVADSDATLEVTVTQAMASNE